MHYTKIFGPVSVFGLWLSICLVTAPFAESQTIPPPESVLGFRVGDDFKLATYDESLHYFQAATLRGRIGARRARHGRFLDSAG